MKGQTVWYRGKPVTILEVRSTGITIRDIYGYQHTVKKSLLTPQN